MNREEASESMGTGMIKCISIRLKVLYKLNMTRKTRIDALGTTSAKLAGIYK
jgi:hypothetical protein